MSTDVNNVLINADKRLFYLSDDVDDATIGKMCFNLLYILQQDDEEEASKVGFERKPIRIYINSGGGEIYAMWSLIDIMLHSKTPIYTYCTGYAMSAALQIYLAGHKRFASKHSRFMYHEMSCVRWGKYQDFVEDRDELDYSQREIEHYVVERTKFTKEQLEEIRKTKRDINIHIDDAIRLGIVHEIIREV